MSGLKRSNGHCKLKLISRTFWFVTTGQWQRLLEILVIKKATLTRFLPTAGSVASWIRRWSSEPKIAGSGPARVIDFIIDAASS